MEKPRPFVRIRKDYRDVAAREETVRTPDKANAVYLAVSQHLCRSNRERPIELLSAFAEWTHLLPLTLVDGSNSERI